MNRFVPLAAVAGLAFASTYLGFRFYHYQQEEASGSLPGKTVPAEAASNWLIKGARVIGAQRPGFSLPDIDGKRRSVSEWDGKVIALNFWATWCPPCLKEIPEFVSLQARHQAAGLQFVGVTLQQADEVRQFVKENKMNYPVLTGEAEVIKLAEAYGNDIGVLPYTVMIDRTGVVAYVKPGPLSREQAESIITRLLKK